MTWENLNNHELQAVRKQLMLDVTEAAEFVGNVSPRSWQRWESGEQKVPSDVNEEMYALVSQMNECIDGAIQQENIDARFYHTFEDFLTDYPGNNKTWWKVHQAVCAWLFSNGLVDELLSDIEVDKESYVYKFFSRTRKEDIEHARQERILREKAQ